MAENKTVDELLDKLEDIDTLPKPEELFRENPRNHNS